MKVKIKKLTENAVIPSYAKDGDMGMDITTTSVEHDASIDCWIYHTGLAFEVPKGYGMLLFPRSSNRKTDCYLANSVGILDSGYRGELLLCFKDRNSLWVKREIQHLSLPPNEHRKVGVKAPYEVGDRICQAVIIPYPYIEFEEVDELSKTERGEGGFGSSDVHR